jgi:predicted dinucleotide-binding enzyme
MMKIGIIGAGNIGGALARRLTKLGHTVQIANSRGPESLAELAQDTGARAAAVTDAAHDADVVIVTIPQKRIPDLPANLLASAKSDAVVIDTGNYYPQQRDGRIAAIEEGMPESVWVQNLLGHPVIKVFNTIAAKNLLNEGHPRGEAGRWALPVAGDDLAAKAKVMALVDALGFDPVDAGGLDESWRQQPGSPVYVRLLTADEVRQALAQANPERPAEFRAAAP